MPYVDVMQRSGLGQLEPQKRLTAEQIAAQAAAVERAKLLAAAKRPTPLVYATTPIWRTSVLMPRLQPLVVKPAVPTTLRVADLKISRPIPLTYGRGFVRPIWARDRYDKTESGSTYKTTQAEVVSGPDIHAPTTGQTISLRETDSIIPLIATREGIRIADETEPTVPTFVEAAAVAPSPWMKYALLAVGGYILYDSFVKSKPKRRKRRRRK